MLFTSLSILIMFMVSKHVSHEILSYFPKWDANVIDSLTFVSIAFLFAEMNSI